MTADLTPLATPEGQLAMVAMDQRESLLAMRRTAGLPTDHESVAEFRIAVARAVAPGASGFLLDREYVAKVTAACPLPPSCGLLLAADHLQQRIGGPVEDTTLDPAITPKLIADTGAAAIKLLLIWKDDGGNAGRIEMAREFIALAEQAGVASVLEPVATACPGERFELNTAIVAAAEALAPLRPTLYKAQVPSRGKGDLDTLVTACRRLDEAIAMPWVVLSNGVTAADFPRAVEAACRGGASGMLAGRAVWADALASPDPIGAVGPMASRRLASLGQIVSQYARPWNSR